MANKIAQIPRGVFAFNTTGNDPLFMGVCPSLNFNVDIESIIQQDYSTGLKTEADETILSFKPKFTLACQHMSPRTLGIFTLGGVTSEAQSESLAESLTITGAVLGGLYDLGFRSVSSVVITGKTEGTDYIVYPEMGYLLIPFNSTITPGDVSVTFDAAAVNYSKIAVYTETSIIGPARYVSDVGSGKQMALDMWNVSIKPGGDMLMIGGNDYATYTLEGTWLSDVANHASEPYGRLYVENGETAI